MISLCTLSTQAFSLDGPIIFRLGAGSELQAAPRRVSRRATLDGACVITDSGFSHGDRTLRLRAEVDESTSDRIWAMHQAYSLVVVGVREGVFLAAVESLEIDGGKLAATILVKEKL